VLGTGTASSRDAALAVPASITLPTILVSAFTSIAACACAAVCKHLINALEHLGQLFKETITEAMRKAALKLASSCANSLVIYSLVLLKGM
jgi:hypothetical protein